MILLCIKQICF